MGILFIRESRDAATGFYGSVNAWNDAVWARPLGGPLGVPMRTTVGRRIVRVHNGAHHVIEAPAHEEAERLPDGRQIWVSQRTRSDGEIRREAEGPGNLSINMVNLTPGMAVTVEINLGKRRLIEFLLSPLLRYRDESVRER